MGIFEKATKFAELAGEYVENEGKNQERLLKSKIHTFSDNQVLRAIECSKTQIAKDVAYNEARRRNLI